jgi:hypothetical protein
MDELEFQEGDRTFTCKAASSPATVGTTWWWVSITGESQRYAAFRTEDGDTPRTVRKRVLAFYEELLAARERPREIRTSWGRRPAAPPASS